MSLVITGTGTYGLVSTIPGPADMSWSFSVMLWVKYNSGESVTWRQIMNKYNDGETGTGAKKIGMGLGGNGDHEPEGYFWDTISTNWPVRSGTVALPSLEWCPMLLTWNHTTKVLTYKCYSSSLGDMQDAALDCSAATLALFSDMNRFKVGGDYDSNAYFPGKIAKVTMWADQVISDGEWSGLKTGATNPRSLYNSDILGHYTLLDTGDNVNVETGHANKWGDMAITGASYDNTDNPPSGVIKPAANYYMNMMRG